MPRRPCENARVSGQAGRYQRTFSGLVASLGLLLVVILAVAGFRVLNGGDKEHPIETVDYASSLPYWRSHATFALLAPPALPQGWVATSVRLSDDEPQAWHLGVLDADGRYLGIEQQNLPVATMVDTYVGDEAERVGTWQGWQEYDGKGRDHALVRRDADVTTLVIGSVSLSRLHDYVALLR